LSPGVSGRLMRGRQRMNRENALSLVCGIAISLFLASPREARGQASALANAVADGCMKTVPCVGSCTIASDCASPVCPSSCVSENGCCAQSCSSGCTGWSTVTASVVTDSGLQGGHGEVSRATHCESNDPGYTKASFTVGDTCYVYGCPRTPSRWVNIGIHTSYSGIVSSPSCAQGSVWFQTLWGFNIGPSGQSLEGSDTRFVEVQIPASPDETAESTRLDRAMGGTAEIYVGGGWGMGNYEWVQ